MKASPRIRVRRAFPALLADRRWGLTTGCSLAWSNLMALDESPRSRSVNLPTSCERQVSGSSV
jgi:hypothetical protein